MIMAQIRYGLVVISNMAFAIMAGIWFSTNRRPKTVAVNRISNTRPVNQVVVSRAFIIALNFNSRWMKNPTNRV